MNSKSPRNSLYGQGGRPRRTTNGADALLGFARPGFLKRSAAAAGHSGGGIEAMNRLMKGGRRGRFDIAVRSLMQPKLLVLDEIGYP